MADEPRSIDGAPYISLVEFMDRGYLHEVNRLVLHPLGLALAVIADNGVLHLGGVVDCRDDPEGIIMAAAVLDDDKGSSVRRLWEERSPARRTALGFMVQPVLNGLDGPGWRGA